MKLGDMLDMNFHTHTKIIQSSEKWHNALWQMAFNIFKDLTAIYRAEEQGRTIALYYQEEASSTFLWNNGTHLLNYVAL